jgi:hypothetical protein
MKITEWIRKRLSAMREAARARREARAELRAEMENREAVQVTEYGGRLYISYEGMPLVDTSLCAVNWVSVLESARSVRKQYMKTRDEQHR